MELKRVEPNSATYSSVVHACSKAAKADQAIEWLHRMEARGFQLDVVAHTSVIGAFARLADMESALGWLDKMEHVQMRPNVLAYTNLVDAYSKAGAEAGEAIHCVLQKMLASKVQPDSVLQAKVSRVLGPDSPSVQLLRAA